MGCIACAALVLDDNGMTLTRKEASSIPVEADSICPDRFAGLGPNEIAALPAYYGRRKVTLGDLFEIEGAATDNVTVSGDLKAVKKIGQGMSMGTITVAGDAGPHLGAFMSGGEIVVQGNAADWVGAHMSGGRIVVKGDAGHFVGAAYSGERHGVSGGTIVIRGNAGREVGGRMRRGLIVVLGDTGEFAGAGMLAGSVFVRGRLGGRPGAGMKRGSIVAFGEAPELLPTFRYACGYRPVFLQCYLQSLITSGVVESPGLPGGEFRRYVGDMNSGGRGEVLVRDQSQ
jgi:formylmethanofuran dehydrogenase subunit C